MCGPDGNIRIDVADNGYTIDTYTPGSSDGPGTHKKMVAHTPEHAVSLLKGHLGKMKFKGKNKKAHVAVKNLKNITNAIGKKQISGKRTRVK